MLALLLPLPPPVGDRRAGRRVGQKELHTCTLGYSGLGISLRGKEQTCYRDGNADDASKVRKCTLHRIWVLFPFLEVSVLFHISWKQRW